MYKYDIRFERMLRMRMDHQGSKQLYFYYFFDGASPITIDRVHILSVI